MLLGKFVCLKFEYKNTFHKITDETVIQCNTKSIVCQSVTPSIPLQTYYPRVYKMQLFSCNELRAYEDIFRIKLCQS